MLPAGLVFVSAGQHRLNFTFNRVAFGFGLAEKALQSLDEGQFASRKGIEPAVLRVDRFALLPQTFGGRAEVG